MARFVMLGVLAWGTVSGTASYGAGWGCPGWLDPVLSFFWRPRVATVPPPRLTGFAADIAAFPGIVDWISPQRLAAVPRGTARPKEAVLPSAVFARLSDPYLQLEALSAAASRLASERDLAGLALLIGQRADRRLDDEPRLDLPRWSRAARPDLGLRLDTRGRRGGSAPLEPTLAAEYEVARGRLREAAAQTRTGKRVSVFGSSRGTPEVNALARELGRALARAGIASVTGGAGGVMEAVNDGTKSEGGQSIGIPVVGTHFLVSEPFPSARTHTLTVPSSRYETRIPLLLSSDAIVVFPGTEGTLREVAALILKLRQGTFPVVFFGKDYWSEIHTALVRFPEAQGTVLLTDSIEETVQWTLR